MVLVFDRLWHGICDDSSRTALRAEPADSRRRVDDWHKHAGEREGIRMMHVSVVMPVYNGQAYIGQALESVLRQQHADFELLILDDASTDKTAEIIDHYARQDDRIG
jgi:cellulose synthase/poly-beta-1,6-N-acetylglucosamine synthase-like glycosyltransferase